MRGRGTIAAAALAVVLLAGCAPEPAGGDGPDSPSPSTEPSSTPSSSPTPDTAPVFRMPRQCAELLTPETAAEFDAAGLDLLGGPGQPYFADPTPEERAGGISCVWGDESDPASTIVISVAPVTTASRSGIVATLVEQGLNESVVDGAISYAQIGDEVSAHAVLNVLRLDSWISVLEALGGEARFQHATRLLDEVTSRVYPTP